MLLDDLELCLSGMVISGRTQDLALVPALYRVLRQERAWVRRAEAVAASATPATPEPASTPAPAPATSEAPPTTAPARLTPREFGQKLRHVREAAGVHQYQLARRCGVDDGRVSRWEQGHSRPSLAQAEALAAFTGWPLDFVRDNCATDSRQGRSLDVNDRTSVVYLGRVIREQRLARGLDRATLALAVGVSTRSIENWERGLYAPAEDREPLLASVIGIDADLIRSVRAAHLSRTLPNKD
jgi:transcriptional regulator with XRE-family HTH domain